MATQGVQCVKSSTYYPTLGNTHHRGSVSALVVLAFSLSYLNTKKESTFSLSYCRNTFDVDCEYMYEKDEPNEWSGIDASATEHEG